MVSTLLLILLILLLIAYLPAWPHANQWGYGPAGGILIVVVVLLILILLGVIPR